VFQIILYIRDYPLMEFRSFHADLLFNIHYQTITMVVTMRSCLWLQGAPPPTTDVAAKCFLPPPSSVHQLLYN